MRGRAGAGARRIDLISPDGAYALFGTSLAQLAPVRAAGTLRHAGVVGLQRQCGCGSIGGDPRTIVSAE